MPGSDFGWFSSEDHGQWFQVEKMWETLINIYKKLKNALKFDHFGRKDTSFPVGFSPNYWTMGHDGCGEDEDV